MIPNDAKAAGFEPTLQLLSTIQAQDATPGPHTRNRHQSKQLYPTPIVLIGSRALAAILQSQSPTVDPSSLPTPAPLFLITDSNNPLPPVNGSDYDFIITPAALADLLQQWHTSSRLRFVYARDELKVLAGVNVEDPNTNDQIYLCEFELLRPKSAWKCSEEAMKRSAECSSLLIAKSAAESGQTVDCSCLGITQPVPIPSLAVQFAIKRSHIYYPFSWRKHIQQLYFLLHHFPQLLKWNVEDITCDLLAYKVYLARQEELAGKWGIPGDHINLSVSNEEFFSESAGGMQFLRQFNHDAIHERIAYGERPLYERYKRDQSKANLDRDLFEAAPLEDQLRLVREECMAIAMERCLVPGYLPPSQASEAYTMALERVCTTLTKGWFRDFAASHYPQVKDLDVDLQPHIAYIKAHPEQFKYVEAVPNNSNEEEEAEEEVEVKLQPVSKKRKVSEDEEISQKHLDVIESFYLEFETLPHRTIYLISKLLKSTRRVKGTRDEWTLKINPKDKGVVLHFEFDRDESDVDVIDAKLGGETFLSFTFKTEREMRFYGSEWGSSTYGEPTYYPTMGTAQPVDRFIAEIFKDESELVPPCLFVAAVFHIIDKQFSRHPLKVRGLRSSFTEGFADLGPIISEDNLGVIWQQAQPFTALLEYAKCSSDFSPISDWSVLPGEVIDQVAHEIANWQSFNEITLSPNTINCDKIMRAVASNGRISTVCFQPDSNVSKKNYEELYPLLYSLTKKQAGTPGNVEVIEKVFKIWSETEALPSTISDPLPNDLGSIAPINVPISNIPSRILSVSSPLYYKHQAQNNPLTFEIGSGTEAIPSKTRYWKRLAMLQDAYILITGRELAKDFPAVLPETTRNLHKTFLFNDKFEPMEHDRCLALMPVDVWLAVIAEIFDGDFEKLALSNTFLGALVVADALRSSKNPKTLNPTLTEVLGKWRELCRKNGRFNYEDYHKHYGVRLYDDLRAAGCHERWMDVQHQNKLYLYGDQK